MTAFLSMNKHVVNTYINDVTIDEPMFFVYLHRNRFERQSMGLQFYLDLYPRSEQKLRKFGKDLSPDGTVRFDKSPGYFDDEAAIKGIATLIPDSRLILIDRDPVERAYSWYQVYYFMAPKRVPCFVAHLLHNCVNWYPYAFS